MDFQNLGKRAAVALIGVPLVLICSMQGGLLFFLLVTAIALGSAEEFLRMAKVKNGQPRRSVVFFGIVCIFLLTYINQTEMILPFLTFFAILLFASEVARSGNNAIVDSCVALFAVGYFGGLFSYLLAVRELPALVDVPYQAGGEWIILILVSIWICDTAAYLVGTLYGERKLAPSVSPNKTVEGALGGIVGGMASALLCSLVFVPDISAWHALVIGLLAGIFGQMSDLVESMFKRDAGVKDSSNLLPGHGGVWDRFDSEVLAVPVIYYYIRFIVF